MVEDAQALEVDALHSCSFRTESFQALAATRESPGEEVDPREVTLFLWLMDEEGQVVSRNAVLFCKPKELRLHDPDLSVQVDECRVTLTAASNCYWVQVRDRARDVLGPDIAVQGNLDPACLLGSAAAVRSETTKILRQNRGRAGHIFNLGHGVLPATPIENVEAMVSAAKEGG